MLRPNSSFTELEALVLDMTLVLHAEHGGGNNSSFTTHVVSSTGTDTYSAIAASLGSLKGPRHGGANLKVVGMFDDLRANITDWEDDEQIADYLHRLLDREAFDRAGLVYGMGHPVYSVSDPRTVILRGYAEKLAEEKGYSEEFELHTRVERIAPLDHLRAAPGVQGRERQRRLLLRLRLPHARHPGRALHAAVRDLARRRLERTPARGTRERQQAHPSGIQERLPAPALRAARRPIDSDAATEVQPGTGLGGVGRREGPRLLSAARAFGCDVVNSSRGCRPECLSSRD